LLIALALASIAALAAVEAQEPKPQIKVPQPGVPEIMTIEGEYVRVAYNNEGYVSLGYRTANQSVGEKWMFIEIGATVREGRPSYTLTRDALSLEVPGGQTVPLPTNREYQAVDLRAMERRATVVHDRIDYFPPMARQACRIGFFSQPGSREIAYDQVELSQNRGCLGRLYFPVPNGITYGQYWLNVKFAQSVVRVPFRILTEDENKLLKKNYKDIKKQVDDAFKKKTK
jgi:hypothetical protein